jgi:hypothetical protein
VGDSGTAPSQNVTAPADRIRTEHGRLDLLVNNTAISRPPHAKEVALADHMKTMSEEPRLGVLPGGPETVSLNAKQRKTPEMPWVNLAFHATVDRYRYAITPARTA